MILALLQARTTSTRLPGKVLLPLLGRPMFLRQVERVKRSSMINKLVIATSADQSDDHLARLCEDEGIVFFRGSLDDVLDRFYRAAELEQPEHVVRLTGDCPLMDPALIDRIIAYHLDQGFDYTSNTIVPTFPDGLDIEVFRFPCLEEAWREAELPSEREHVTLFMINRPERFKLGVYFNERDLSHLRWTVDERLDYELIKLIFENLYHHNPEFTAEDVLGFLQANPDLATMNSAYQRNEGLQKSLQEDEEYRKGR